MQLKDNLLYHNHRMRIVAKDALMQCLMIYLCFYYFTIFFGKEEVINFKITPVSFSYSNKLLIFL